MSPMSWIVAVIALLFALVPGFLVGTRLERVALIVVPLLSFGWIAASNVIFGTRDQLYGGGSIIFMALLPPVLCIWALASFGAGLLVKRAMSSLGGERALTFGWTAGITMAVALPLALVIGGVFGV